MAVPYSNCSENRTSVPQTPIRKSKRSSKKYRKYDAYIVSINPYEREGVDVLRASEPYELYERPELSSTYGIDKTDQESCITHDEFLFTIGPRK